MLQNSDFSLDLQLPEVQGSDIGFTLLSVKSRQSDLVLLLGVLYIAFIDQDTRMKQKYYHT